MRQGSGVPLPPIAFGSRDRRGRARYPGNTSPHLSLKRRWGDAAAGRAVADYPADAGSLTASVRFRLGYEERGAVRTRRTAALPRSVRVSDIRVRCTPRGSRLISLLRAFTDSDMPLL
jgi:hypothetical protein